MANSTVCQSKQENIDAKHQIYAGKLICHALLSSLQIVV